MRNSLIGKRKYKILGSILASSNTVAKRRELKQRRIKTKKYLENRPSACGNGKETKIAFNYLNRIGWF